MRRSQVGSVWATYQLLHFCWAEAGWARFYEAEDTPQAPECEMALKLISPRPSPAIRCLSTDATRGRPAGTRLTEAHIVPIADYGEIQRTVLCRNTHDRPALYAPIGSVWSLTETVAIVRQIAATLWMPRMPTA